MAQKKTDLNLILRNIPLEIKQWIYNNPQCLDKKEFELKCNAHKQLGKQRYCEIRGRLIDCLTLEEQAHLNFARAGNFNKPSPDKVKLQAWITKYALFSYINFKNHHLQTRNPSEILFSKRISERVFKMTKRKMKKRGILSRVRSEKKVDKASFPHLFDPSSPE